jgi:hypothetical protein
VDYLAPQFPAGFAPMLTGVEKNFSPDVLKNDLFFVKQEGSPEA